MKKQWNPLRINHNLVIFMEHKTHTQRLRTISLKKITYEEGKFFITHQAIMGLQGNPVSNQKIIIKLA